MAVLFQGDPPLEVGRGVDQTLSPRSRTSKGAAALLFGPRLTTRGSGLPVLRIASSACFSASKCALALILITSLKEMNSSFSADQAGQGQACK